jgi:magnesium transporter
MRLTPSNISIIKRLLVGRGSRPLRSLLAKVDPEELITLFPTLTISELRLLIDALRSIHKAVETLSLLNDTQLSETLESLEDPLIDDIIRVATDDDAAHFLSLMPKERVAGILSKIGDSRSGRIQLFLSYPKDSAGRLMQTEVFSLPTKITAGQALDSLRLQAAKEFIYYLYCVDDEGRLEGVISMRHLATSPPDKALKDLLSGNLVFVYPGQSASEAATLVSKYGFIAVPVVDEDRRLLGLITVDEIVDMIQEQATAELYAQAGLQEDDRVYTPALTSIKNRAPWMFVNLGLAAVASSIVSLFEDTMTTLIILASLKNIVAGISGNTAIQTLTVVTRGLAIGDFKTTTHLQAIKKEIVVGVSLGLIMGFAAGILIYFWKQDTMVSVVICMSMILNSFVAAGFGACVPLVLRRFDLDPATGSGVIVTMVTDIFSFFSFLGIASLGLKFFS